MATLILARNETAARPLAVGSLRRWLRGSWALLFSHPDDFARYDLEADRWLVALQQAFSREGVLPIAVAPHPPHHSASWIAQVGGSAAAVLLEDAPARAGIVDLNACALREAVARTASRFVMIVDDSLRVRRTFLYAALDRLPSLLDFAATAGKLRSACTDQPKRLRA